MGRQDSLRAQLAGAGQEVAVSASVFRQDDAAFVLVRLAPVRPDAPPRLRSNKRIERGVGASITSSFEAPSEIATLPVLSRSDQPTQPASNSSGQQ